MNFIHYSSKTLHLSELKFVLQRDVGVGSDHLEISLQSLLSVSEISETSIYYIERGTIFVSFPAEDYRVNIIV